MKKFTTMTTCYMIISPCCMQDLQEILMKLRDEHNYCLFCGCQVSENLLILLYSSSSFVILFVRFIKAGGTEIACINLTCGCSMTRRRHFYPTAQE